MTDYVKATDFAIKDGFASGNAAKQVLGTELDDEFNLLATASASKEDSSNKSSANGYAGLDASTLVNDAELPSASETVRGVAQIATQAQTDAGATDTRIITPLKLANATSLLQATEIQKGAAELATQAETNTGTDDLRIVTPLKLANATSLLQATDIQKGALEIATGAEVITGTDNVRAITPLALQSLTATETRSGIIELATQVEVDAGTDTDRAVTPATLAGTVLSPGRNGAKVFDASSQSIAGTGADVVVDFDSEAYDTNSFHDTVTNNPRITIPSGVTQVRLTANVMWTASSSSYRTLKIRKNGADGAIDDNQGTYQPWCEMTANVGPNTWHQQCSSGIIQVANTDFFEVVVRQGSGGALNLIANQSWFMLEIIE